MTPISQPVFIAGPARSGTSLLLSILSKASGLWSPYRELHGIYEWRVGLAPDFTGHPNGTSGRDDNVLTDEHATPSRAEAVPKELFRESTNIELLNTTHSVGAIYHLLRAVSRAWKRVRMQPIRVVDKNPKHCFRVSFLRELFPEAQFVFLYRSPEANISSLIEGWESGEYATYRVPWEGERFQWHFDLPPGWKHWVTMSLPERCARLRAEERLPESDFVRCHYEEMIEQPLRTARSLLYCLDVEVTRPVRDHCESLPVVNSVTAPDPEKWRKREETIRRLTPVFAETASEIGYEAAV